MSSNWEVVKLGDYCSKIGSGSTPRGGSNIYLDVGQFALIRSQNILNNSFSINGLVYIDENEANKLKNVSV
jgi:type I restriction enzyme S subunit